MSFFGRIENFFDTLADRFRRENDERRREDRELELGDEVTENELGDPSGPVKITSVDFQAKINASNHHCEKYELIERQKDVSIIRRGGNFTLIVTFNQEVELKKTKSTQILLFLWCRPQRAEWNTSDSDCLRQDHVRQKS